jgi:uncharacterized protein
MKIAPDDIREQPRHLAYVEPAEPMNAKLARGADELRLTDGLAVDVSYRRAGLDVFLDGVVRGEVRGCCARCLGETTFPLEASLELLLAPAAVGGEHDGALREDEIGLAWYEGDEIDLTPLVHEQALLALPTRVLCGESCRGLCPRCGGNLNAGPCDCPAATPDGPLAALQTILRDR